MITIRSVLCPVDFSACAGRALGHAAMVARRFDASLTVLYAAERMPTSQTPFAGYAAIPLPPVPVDELREEMRRFAEPLVAAAPVPRFLVREGHPLTEIVAEAEGMTDGVVVMGTHGRSGIERVWLGSVTERVLRRVRCPVLTVPPGASTPARPAHDAAAAPYRTIICAVDFSDASIRAVEHALTWAQEANARVIFLHVLEPQLDASTVLVAGHFSVPEYFGYVKKDAEERLSGMIPADVSTWCTPEQRLISGKPYQAIVKTAAEEQADLIIMGVFGRSPLSTAALGSTTNQVLRHASCPVLTVRA